MTDRATQATVQPKTWLSLAAAVMTFVLAAAKAPAPVLAGVEYVHYAERLYSAAESAAPEHKH